MTTKKPETAHFDRVPRRKAEFIKPVNQLQSKVGYGGLDEKKLKKAEAVLENIPLNFKPTADKYLNALMQEIRQAKGPAPVNNGEELITRMLEAATQLKAGGGMCGHTLIAKMADKLIQFLEVIEEPNQDAMEIVHAFHEAMQAALVKKLGGSSGRNQQELLGALDAACWRYFEHYPGKRALKMTAAPQKTNRPQSFRMRPAIKWFVSRLLGCRWSASCGHRSC